MTPNKLPIESSGKTSEKEIKREAALCRKSLAKTKVGDVVQHCHHESWLEILTEHAENRIAYILKNKAEDEQAERLLRFRPFDWKKADADWKKADADWKKADADREKADADWKKADADREKAYADREKAYADWKKAYADREKAYADWKKADADWKKADADREKAYADWEKACTSPPMIKLHAEVCGCAWGKNTDIFGNAR